MNLNQDAHGTRASVGKSPTVQFMFRAVTCAYRFHQIEHTKICLKLQMSGFIQRSQNVLPPSTNSNPLPSVPRADFKAVVNLTRPGMNIFELWTSEAVQWRIWIWKKTGTTWRLGASTPVLMVVLQEYMPCWRCREHFTQQPALSARFVTAFFALILQGAIWIVSWCCTCRSNVSQLKWRAVAEIQQLTKFPLQGLGPGGQHRGNRQGLGASDNWRLKAMSSRKTRNKCLVQKGSCQMRQ